MTIKEEVLEEHFGTKGLKWVDNCPPDEISKEDIYAVIDIAIQETLEKIMKLGLYWKNNDSFLISRRTLQKLNEMEK